MALKTLNIIGCGKVGKTLGFLWSSSGTFEIKGVVNSSFSSAHIATEFLGAGTPFEHLKELPLADTWMLAVSDDSIVSVAQELKNLGLVCPGNIVFHCSGAIPAMALSPLQELGATIASIHPIKSFADAVASVKTFRGTYCAIEGDTVATRVLTTAIQNLGGNVFSVNGDQKLLYHAGAVMIGNIIVLLEVSLRCYEKAGIPRDVALQAIEPFVRTTIDNVIRLGPAQALTGPIARGDVKLVAAQHAAVGAWDTQIADLYACLGQTATELSMQQGKASKEALLLLRSTLKASVSAESSLRKEKMK